MKIRTLPSFPLTAAFLTADSIFHSLEPCHWSTNKQPNNHFVTNNGEAPNLGSLKTLEFDVFPIYLGLCLMLVVCLGEVHVTAATSWLCRRRRWPLTSVTRNVTPTRPRVAVGPSSSPCTNFTVSTMSFYSFSTTTQNLQHFCRLWYRQLPL